MRVNAIFRNFIVYFLVSFFLTGCALFSNLKIPLQIKAIVEGEIGGIKIHCEENLELAKGNWQLMCGLNNEVSIKYRIKSIGPNQNKVGSMEFSSGHYKLAGGGLRL